MSTAKTLATAAALFMIAGPALAVTVENKSDKEVSIGVDWGNEQEVKKIAAGKSTSFECKDGCGVTGPWDFSWMASGDTTITTDGKSMIYTNKNS